MTVTDAGGLSHTEAVTIGVTNQNEAPTDITVAGGTVQENAAAGTVVATLGATDADAGSTFTYTLDDPSGKFEVVGDEIRVKAGASLDYESASSHQVTVTVTDAGGLSHTEALTIGVSNQNEAPTDITVAGGTVQENAAAGTVVATLGAADADAGSTFTYTLDDPSGKFEVVGDEIRVKAGASLDYESAIFAPGDVTVTDAGGLSHTEALTIGVSNQNEAPIDITVAGGTVQENAAAGTVVATLGAADADAGSTFTYTLDDPSGMFEVVGDEIRVKAGASLDYESASSHQVTVTVTDAGGLSHSETLTIGVTNQNEAPIDITVAGGSVQENAAAGTVVATLGAADADAGSTFTYTLDDPSGLFEVVGDEIRVKAGASLDYESASSHQVTVTVTDAGGLSHSEALTIGVSNQNEAPIDITVAGGTVQENAAAGTVVATLGAADADAGSTFTYTLDDPSGKFEVVGDEIRVKAGASLDYESASSHQVTVTVTDAGGLSHSEALTIGVSNQNEAPIDITVAGGTVQENAAAGTVVATLGAADADAGSTFTYTLDDPSGMFEVVGDEIRVKAGASLDYESASSHQVTVTVTDAGGLSHSEALTIGVSNQNEAPIDITVAGGTVQENAAAGTVVATLGAADADAGSTFTYTLDDPSGLFEVVGDEIRVKAGASLDYESASSHPVTVTVTDAGGLSHSEALTIGVSNQNEAPIDITVAGGTVQENAAAGTVVATLGAADADAGSTFTYTLDDPSGLFEVVGDEIRVKAGASLDYESASSHPVTVTVTDAGGLSHSEALTIGVSNQNEAPIDITVAGGTVQENAAAGTVVATLGAADADAGSTFTYTLDDPSGLFEVVGDEIRVKAGASLDYESASSHPVTVTVTDAGGLSHSEALTIGVSNQNEAPIDITVAGGTVQENAAAGTVVATLGAADADAGSTFTYTLDDPSGLFEVVGDEIRVKAGASLDYESASSHPVTVTVTDAGGLSHSEALTIGVSNQNEAPIDITVAGGTVQENAAAGTVVATLGAADADAGSTFTYTLDDPSGLFEVVGDEIRVKAGASLDYESASSHPVTVTVTDAGGLSHSEALTIGVSNQNEAPTDITVAGGTVQENAAAGTVVATLGAADADAGSTFTYTLDDPSGLFEVVGDEIRVKAGAKEGGGKSEPVGDEIPMKGDANLDKESSGKLEPVVYDTPKVGAGLDAGEDSKVEPLDDEPRVRPGTGLDYESALRTG